MINSSSTIYHEDKESFIKLIYKNRKQCPFIDSHYHQGYMGIVTYHERVKNYDQLVQRGIPTVRYQG